AEGSIGDSVDSISSLSPKSGSGAASRASARTDFGGELGDGRSTVPDNSDGAGATVSIGSRSDPGDLGDSVVLESRISREGGGSDACISVACTLVEVRSS